MSQLHPRIVLCFVLCTSVLSVLACGGGGGRSTGTSGDCFDTGCKIVAADGEANENFGVTVGIFERTIVVGAPEDREAGVDAGSAYIFRIKKRDAVQKVKILASDAAVGDKFGRSVAAGAEDMVAIGAWDDDDRGEGSGSVYVYRLIDDVWSEVQKLTADDGDEGDRFGRSIAIDGDVMVIGADRDEETALDAGAVYVFRHNGTSWLQEQKLLADEGAASDDFGDSVAISGDRIVVGAGLADTNGLDSGAAYVFRYDVDSWFQEQRIVALDGLTLDEFGDPVAIDGDLIVVGADDADDTALGAGAAYVFRLVGGLWTQEEKLLSSDGEEGDDFGDAVAVRNGVVVVGAIGDDDEGTNAGAIYLYSFDGADWVEDEKVLIRDGSRGDDFGHAIGMHDDFFVVGANREDGLGDRAGAAYVFER